ncbi:MAG: poly-gamma-glutamate synthase PgsB [Candidatus Cloacimonetes bacterium]|nr:poly-gamma-glutamate synthase PgsB [Candidatus Cloacimonadota bacterium]MBS3767352.1 poly-gamma-glutamate synthase PgsB [Candidatus Cloacimonadota bacterium]
MLILVVALLFLILFTLFEFRKHHICRDRIPGVVHINGTRGKSSVTRLIAAGLRAGGKKTIAKTTGSAPRVILESGEELPIERMFGANIREQTKIMKFAARRKIDALVLECMAITPEYQWVTEHKMAESDVGVITNIRPDHLDVMGPGIKNVAYSICNTIPSKAKLYTSEEKYFNVINRIARENETQAIFTDKSKVSDEEIKKFPFFAHKENVSLALEVCKNYGIDRSVALNGMYKMKPDIGATKVYTVDRFDKKIHFVHALAANDPKSTRTVIKNIKQVYEQIEEIYILLNTREDRFFRSKQLIKMLAKEEFEKLYLIGRETARVKSFALKNKIDQSKIMNIGWTYGDELITLLSQLDKKEIWLFGIGNIGGNGGLIVKYFKQESKKENGS